MIIKKLDFGLLAKPLKTTACQQSNYQCNHCLKTTIVENHCLPQPKWEQ